MKYLFALMRTPCQFLPQQFAIANGLINKKRKLILIDERQRSWKLKLSSGSTRAPAYIGDGWRKFVAETFLKEGDRVMFEVVTNGETPIWKFQSS
ncbi:putative xyloglucan glycosyltransferase 5-like [Capsicum annuum]|nr:putative xyloglucan glycosyltransferase 5-like [Capsicum annuum]